MRYIVKHETGVTTCCPVTIRLFNDAQSCAEYMQECINTYLSKLRAGYGRTHVLQQDKNNPDKYYTVAQHDFTDPSITDWFVHDHTDEYTVPACIVALDPEHSDHDAPQYNVNLIPVTPVERMFMNILSE